jgi:hypothetical protein
MTANDEREALKTIIYTYETIDFAESQNFTTRDCYGVVDAILAAGFRRQGPMTEAKVEAAANAIYAHQAYQLNGVESERLARAALEAAEVTS